MASWNFEAEAANAGKRVAVVGRSSPVGDWLCRRLLQKGYRVVSALPTEPEQVAELMGMSNAEDGFEVEAIDSEVCSTLNVVEACANTATIDRLLLTSCASAMVFDQQQSSSGVETVDERCWSDLDFCRQNKLWGAVCKTLSEKAAWALARDRGVDLVVINPATVVGPKATTNSHNLLSSLKERKQNPVMAFAHVDDVAEAHIHAFEKPKAAGRFLCYHRLFSNTETRELQDWPPGLHTISSRFIRPWESGALSNEKLLRLATM